MVVAVYVLLADTAIEEVFGVAVFAIRFVIHELGVIPCYYVFAAIAVVKGFFETVFAVFISFECVAFVSMVEVVAAAAFKAVVVGAFFAPFRILLTPSIPDDYGS